MSEQLPSPEFDSQNYARPNEGWICGHASEGKACPLGPDRRGRCQATAECVPSLETMPGETKGRWRCNRSGEKCETGPLPNGSCCRPIARCAPVPTLRTIRGRLNLAFITATCAALLILLGIPRARRTFINPGPLSVAHSSLHFAQSHGGGTNDQSCSACHASGGSGPHGILTAGLQSEPRPWNLAKLISIKRGAPTAMDDACQKCHVAHSFHQPNTSREVGCAACHREHQGTGGLTANNDAQCGLCHADPTVMTMAATKGAQMPARDFALPRPPGGFTEVIHSFASDHPEFRTLLPDNRDPDTLKFNHHLHLDGTTIPALANGKKLDCIFCHQPEATGSLMRPVRFENHCQVCHSLQFDPETPELTLPHGSAESVSAFLHSLPQQYLAVAQRQGIANADQRKKFAEEKLSSLRAQLQPGEDVERRIFFSSAVAGPSASAGVVQGATRALYPGCAYCHEVKAGTSNTAEITKPVLIERWFSRAQFEHSKHSSTACTQCHAAQQSSKTADVLLPSKAICVECHSSRGGVADSCVTCHTYHRPAGLAALKPHR